MLVAHLPIVLLRTVVMIVVAVVTLMLLLHIVKIIKSLVILTSVHEMLSLVAILIVHAKVVNHVRTCWRSRWAGRVGQYGSSRPVRRGGAVVVPSLMRREEMSTTRLMEAI